MDNSKNKTSLEEAKINFEEIKKFALEEARKEIKKEIDEKVEKMLGESLQTISLDIDSEKDEVKVTVSSEEGEPKVIEINTATGDVEVEDKKEDEEEIAVDGKNEEPEEELDNEPIEIDEKIDEMENIQEEPQVAQSAETNAEPTQQKELIDNFAKALAGIINPTEFGQAALGKVDGGESVSQDVEFINDEEPKTPEVEPQIPVEEPVVPEVPVAEPQVPAETPTAPATTAVPTENPEEKKSVAEDDAILEFDLENINKEEESDQIFEIEMEEEPKEKVFEIEVEDENIEEMKGVSKPIRNTSSRLGLEPREGTPNLQESKKVNKQKAQYESKIDELQKENKRLNESVNEFKNTFTDLRKQFDEMQTFNAKLAYANKILSSGGFSTEDKIKITEEFDKAKTTDDAKKIYDKILNEGVVTPIKNVDVTSKLKSVSSHSIQPKEPLFESVEMKRMKELAGLGKKENN